MTKATLLLAALVALAACKDKAKKKDEWATGKYVPPPEPKKQEKLAPLPRLTCAPAGTLSTWRFDPVLAPLPGGKVLVAGGRQGKKWLSSSEIFDPAAGRSRAAGPMKHPRAVQGVLPLADGRVLVYGGGERALELFEPARRGWRVVGSLAKPAVGVLGTQLPDGQVYLAGGELTDRRGMSADAFLWEPKSGKLRPLPPLKRPLRGQAFVDGAGKVVLLARGEDEARSSLLVTDPKKGTLEPYNSDELLVRSLRELARMPRGDETRLLWSSDGKLASPPTGLHDKLVLRFFPSRMSWRTLARPSRNHDNGAALALDRGRILVLGGADAGHAGPEICTP